MLPESKLNTKIGNDVITISTRYDVINISTYMTSYGHPMSGRNTNKTNTTRNLNPNYTTMSSLQNLRISETQILSVC